MGAAEMCCGMRVAQRAGYACTCVLTHPGEFFRWRGGDCVPIRKNMQRWERLLRFLDATPGFDVIGIDAIGSLPVPRNSPPDICVPAWTSVLRVLEQGMDRVRVRLRR